MGRKTAVAEIDEKINRFLRRQRQILDKFKTFQQFVSNFGDNSQLAELKVRLGNVEPLFTEFESISLDLSILDESRYDQDEYEAFESNYFLCIAAATELINKHEKGQNLAFNRVTQQSRSNSPQLVNANKKLPQIGLPKFWGDYDKFPQFLETFTTLIDKNPNLDNIQKFYYLIDALEGEAKKVLECLEVTNANYKIAIDLVSKRFYNKPLIIQSHLKALFDAPNLQKESHYLIQGLVDSIH